MIPPQYVDWSKTFGVSLTSISSDWYWLPGSPVMRVMEVPKVGSVIVWR